MNRINEPTALWWKKISLRDITILTAVVGMVISLLNFTGKKEDVVKRLAVARSLQATMHRINQEITFRTEADSEELGDILSQLSKEAKNLAPNDPYVVTYDLYTRLVVIARSPNKNQVSMILALSIYPDELKKNYPKHTSLIDGIYEDWMMYAGTCMLNLIIQRKVTETNTQNRLYHRAYECLVNVIESAENKGDKRRLVAL